MAKWACYSGNDLASQFNYNPFTDALIWLLIDFFCTQPDRPDELSRIENSGDNYLKSYVIPEPEVTIRKCKNESDEPSQHEVRKESVAAALLAQLAIARGYIRQPFMAMAPRGGSKSERQRRRVGRRIFIPYTESGTRLPHFLLPFSLLTFPSIFPIVAAFFRNPFSGGGIRK
ncbi:hypothetical protein HAX54_049004 [Datura stramonium]|uniref:Uncharacterized protein n=1 Tax=Datura stramonium TaxID=4076 RepID=A0ABS8SW88_DATST|nr:hypothetical protein [Datura stramonium]